MTRLTMHTGALALAIAGALAVAGCGSDDSSSGAGDHGGHDMQGMTTTTAASTAADVDKAFVAQMIPHHEMAIEMARYAPARAQRPEIRSLGTEIEDAQAPEIAQMRAIARRLGVTPGSMSAGGTMDHAAMGKAAATLGISMDDMGMSMDMASLRTAKPFDRAFIDQMIPHHQGAITMARAQLARGQDPELKKIATAIVAAQKQEIEQMNRWREAWYGSASPTGGVPAS